MNLYKLKMKIKHIPCVNYLYGKLIGNRKVLNIEKRKKEALKMEGEDIIREIFDVLSKSEARYFVDMGTLLGIVRNQGILSWDNDMDYGLIIDEKFNWDMLEELLNKKDIRKVRQFIYENKVVEQTYEKRGVFIDFFGHYIKDNGSIFYSFIREKDTIYDSPNIFETVRFDVCELNKIKLVKYNDVTWSIPENAEEYLACLYGKNWKIPNPNWVSYSGPCCKKIPNQYGYLEMF